MQCSGTNYAPCGRREDEYQKPLDTAKQMAVDEVRIKNSVITDELRDLVIFLVHSFIRPIETELYALKHSAEIYRQEGAAFRSIRVHYQR